MNFKRQYSLKLTVFHRATGNAAANGTFLYTGCSNNLRNLFLLGQSLVEVTALLGVREVLKLENL